MERDCRVSCVDGSDFNMAAELPKKSMDIASNTSIFPQEKDIPADYKLPGYLEQREYLINGELCRWNGATQSVKSPICVLKAGVAEVVTLGEYPILGRNESLQALDAAVNAYDGGLGVWPAMAAEERISCMQCFLEGMRTKRDEIVNLIMWEIGKTLPDARKEFDRTITYIEETIEALSEMKRAESKVLSREGIDAKLGRMSLGTVLCVAPFNYPLNETFTTLIPALLMGNTVVFKPPKLGVLLHQPLLELFGECFPPGVVNTVYGDGRVVLTPLMESGKVNAFAFIGSTGVAEVLIDAHPAAHRLTSILGMGAKNPGVVLADADIDMTVAEVVRASLSFNGQRCTALKEIFVQRAIVDEFVAKLSAAVSNLKVGMPWEPGVTITPLPEEGKTERLSAYVQDALSKGATVTNERGAVVEGTTFSPAVLFPVVPGMEIYDVEQFGPIVPVSVFDEVEQVVQRVKNSNFRQQVSIFGKDSRQLEQLADRFLLLVPGVNINTQCQRGPDNLPFGGKGDSALGTLSIVDALLSFSIATKKAAKTGGLPSTCP